MGIFQKIPLKLSLCYSKIKVKKFFQYLQIMGGGAGGGGLGTVVLKDRNRDCSSALFA